MAEPGDRAVKLRAGKFDVDVPMVERLIAAQFPQWADLPVRPVANDGWDNWTFHLGDRMKVRLPSDKGYVEQVEKEARWLPLLAPHLPLPVPVPIGVGGPGEGYPWPWIVLDWIEGEVATPERVSDRVAFARDVAGFIAALQQVDTSGGPIAGKHSFFRGSPIDIYVDEARGFIDRLAGRIDTAAAHAVMDAAVAAKWQGPDVWVHGDIAVGNLLVREGSLAAVLDFGCSAVGDPACDLVIAWTFLDGASREAFRSAVPGDAGTWARARGWALWKAALLMAQNDATNRSEASPAEVIEAVLDEHRRQG